MTQADILAKNEETFTNLNIIKDLTETYDSAVAAASGFRNPTFQTDEQSVQTAPTPSTSLQQEPTISITNEGSSMQQQQARLSKPDNFGDNEFTPYEMTEQSPIRPSKYFATDRLLILACFCCCARNCF